VAGSGLYTAWLLIRTGSPYSAAGLLVVVTATAAAAVIALDPTERLTRAALLAAAGALLLGPLLFSLQTATTPHTGSLPSAGPVVAGASMRGGGPGGMGPGGPGGPQRAGGPGGGGLLDASSPSAELVAILTRDAADYTWIAAAVGSQNGAGYQLATGYSVMPIGGFNGSDPSPTLAQFQQLVADGDIHWFIASSGGPGGPGGSRTGSTQSINTWVAQNFTSTTVDGVTLYDLTTRA
jgi:4-amino-4-deoxy-L-arabinose transferase-like glycosyltransferase